MITLYASPSGTGDGLSIGSPGSIATVKAAAAGAGDDVTVYLRGGTYPVASALAFTSADSPQVGHRTTWQAYPGELPIVECGVQVTGWSLHDAGSNIWSATVPAGTYRQLWVADQRCQRARYTGTMPTYAGSGTFTGTGFPAFARPTDLEFAWVGASGRAWTENRFGVASATLSGGTTTFTLLPGYNVNTGINIQVTPSWIENAYEFLSSSTPGQYHFDPAASTLYYVPRTGEDMATADCWLGGIETAIDCAGLSRVTFTGIQFQHTGWTRPTVAGGFLEIQANVFQEPSGAYNAPPAAITLRACTDVYANRNAFWHLGAKAWNIGRYGVGPAFADGGAASSGCQAIGNIAHDLGTTGAGVGDLDLFQFHGASSSGTIVRSNRIVNPCQEFRGGVGIVAGWLYQAKINHNLVQGASYTGISVGWGWTTYDYSQSTGIGSNEVAYNLIKDVMLVLADGGSVYVNGGQQNSSVHDNYCLQTTPVPANKYYALYLDDGSLGWDVSNNVVWNYPSWNYVSGSGTGGITGAGNWSKSGSGPGFSDPYIGNIDGSSTLTDTGDGVTPNVSAWPAAAQAIVAAAGPEAAYPDVAEGSSLTPLTAPAAAAPATAVAPTASVTSATSASVTAPPAGAPATAVMATAAASSPGSVSVSAPAAAAQATAVAPAAVAVGPAGPMLVLLVCDGPSSFHAAHLREFNGSTFS